MAWMEARAYVKTNEAFGLGISQWILSQLNIPYPIHEEELHHTLESYAYMDGAGSRFATRGRSHGKLDD